MKLIRQSLYTCVLFTSLVASAVHTLGTPNVGRHDCFVRVDPPAGKSYDLPLNVSYTSTDTLARIEAQKICEQLRNADIDKNTFHCDRILCSPISE
ncbi:MAG: hypothetical protein IPK04_15170 [Bdellovibrionales bacterium]|jgi:hypothetical protein|nr:hypothetical protein [Bdellovibrionales bacterium]